MSSFRCLRRYKSKETFEKFHMKLRKSSTEIYSLLKQVYGNEDISCARVFNWLKNFQNGRDSHLDPPSTSKNIEEIGNLFLSDRRRLSIRAIAEILRIDKKFVRQSLYKKFGMQKVCAEVVPKILMCEQQEDSNNVFYFYFQFHSKYPKF
ncbi:FLJ37770-like protein [Trichonephila clavipes]|uniref:FLJ37770-like protein n=1 Tax=Trichonephila clavipes TaxID=2585209 RepID=A0A8X6RGL3_TRICX|nr:FLJ37770-like protein [Trichonephila clavipes]